MRPAVMGNDTKVRRSHPVEAPCLEKDNVKFPRASKSTKLQDKPNALKSAKSLKPISAEQQIVGSKSQGISSNNQRPYRDGTGVEELVKYMSNVPAYVQLLGRGDSNQEKALNVGVLDWKGLRKWTDSCRPSITKEEIESSLDCFASSSCSTRGSFIPSHRSGDFCDSIDPPRKLSPYRRYLPSRGTEEYPKCSVPERSSRQFASFVSLEIASMNTSVGQTQLHSTECSQEKGHMDGCEKSKARYSTSTPCSDAIGLPQIISSAGSRSCELTHSSTRRNLSKASCKLRNNELQASEGEGLVFVDSPVVHGNSPHGCITTCPSQADNYLLDDNHLFSFESSDPKNMGIELDRNRFAGPSSEDKHLAFMSRDVSHSCPLPSNTDSSTWSETNRGMSGSSRFAPSDESDSTLLNMDDGVLNNRFIDTHTMQKSNIVLTKHSMLSTPRNPAKSAFKMSERSTKDAKRAVTPVPRDSSPIRSLIASFGMIKSPNSRGGSITNQSRGPSFAGNTITMDKTNADSKARRSPLRRMLDPLLKPKSTDRQQHPPAESQPNITPRPSFSNKSPRGNAMRTRRNLINSYSGSVDSHGENDRRNLTSSCWDSPEPCGGKHEKHRETSQNQALLRLTWKNGQPLYTFSMNNVDLLAATKSSSSVRGKAELECVYTFYFVHEMEQKTCRWMNQRNKNRGQTLISSVIGQMNVSCVPSFERWGDGTKTCVFLRQFILLGPELKPSSPGVKQSLPDSELAAMVIRCYKKITKNRGCELMQCVVPRDPSYVNLAGDNREALEDEEPPSIVAILPGEVHGLSNQGAPSSLIDRWKFGGSCDCGGWDAGCSLTILKNNLQENCRSDVTQSCHSTDDTRGTDLFIQGGCSHERSNPAFSLVAFKDGVYTVQFDSSIAVLQAFSVCIATLHSRKAKCFPNESNEIQAVAMESSLKKHHGGRIQLSSSATYLPHHPPLSPVGRA